MIGFLSGLFGLLSTVAAIWERWLLRREARKLAEADLITHAADKVVKAAEIIAEHRDADDAARRLRDGTF